MARVAALALSAGGLAFVVPRSSTSTSSLRGVSVSAPAAEPTSSASWGAAAATATAALGLAAASATSATRRTARKAVGVCLPLTDKFDPLNLASTDEKLERYTQVEIKHGRVAMIAVVGYIMPEIFRFPGCESFQHGLAALESIPLEGWVQLVALVGAHEVLVKPRAGGLGSSDFGLGTELIDGIDEAELERKQTSERNNGRLAMVAIMGLMVQDGMFGEPPLSYMSKYGWWGEPVQWYVQHLNNCQSFSGSFVDNAGVCALPSRGGRTALRATKLSEGPFIETETYPAPKEMEMSAAVPFLRYPQVLKGWVGEEKGFDPLGVTDALPVYWVREAELKHGRVCMLATVGWIATDLGMRFPGDQFQSVQTTLEAHDKMVEAGLMAPFLGAVGTFELYSLWLFFKGWEMEVNRDAGDFFLGKQFLPKEPAKEKDMRLKELENGRLAMFAFSGIVTQAAMTGQASLELSRSSALAPQGNAVQQCKPLQADTLASEVSYENAKDPLIQVTVQRPERLEGRPVFSAAEVQSKLEAILASTNRQVAARSALLCSELVEATKTSGQNDSFQMTQLREISSPRASSPLRADPGFFGDHFAREGEEAARQARLQQPHLDHQHTERRWERTNDRDCEWILRTALNIRDQVIQRRMAGSPREVGRIWKPPAEADKVVLDPEMEKIQTHLRPLAQTLGCKLGRSTVLAEALVPSSAGRQILSSGNLASQIGSWLPPQRLLGFRRIHRGTRDAVQALLATHEAIRKELDEVLRSALGQCDNRVWVGIRVRPNANENSTLQVEKKCVTQQLGSTSATFFFDQVFGESARQADVWSSIQGPIMRSLLRKEHVCLFAYGQTGSGKTHTVFGDPSSAETAGIAFRITGCLSKVLQHTADPEAEEEPHVEFSFLEVYNEKVHDLLANSKLCHLAGEREELAPGSQFKAPTLSAEERVVVRGLTRRTLCGCPLTVRKLAKQTPQEVLTAKEFAEWAEDQLARQMVRAQMATWPCPGGAAVCAPNWVEALRRLVAERLQVKNFRTVMLVCGNRVLEDGWEPTYKESLVAVLRPFLVPEAVGALATEILAAAHAGNTQETVRLLELPLDPDTSNDQGRAALHAAAERGHLEVARCLLDVSADVNKADNHGESPMYHAAVSDHAAMLQYLLTARAEILKANDPNQTPMLHAAAGRGNLTVVRILLEAGAEKDKADYFGYTPMHGAALSGQLEVVRALLEAGADKDKANYVPEASHEHTGLHEPNGDFDIVRWLVEHGHTPMHAAATYGHWRVVHYLLEAGAEKDPGNCVGRTPMHLACGAGFLDVVKVLLRASADKDKTDSSGRSPLMVAAINGRVEVVKCLLGAGADKSLADHKLETPMYHAAMANHTEVVRLFAKTTADIEEHKALSAPILHAVAGEGNLEVVRFLVELGMDKDEHDNFGCAPMHFAALNGKLEVVRYLLEVGAERDKANHDLAERPPDEEPEPSDNYDIVRWYVEDQHTPLHAAASFGHLRVVRYLLEAGVRKDPGNYVGRTPLHLACGGGFPDTVRCLLTARADKDKPDTFGRTPLVVAAIKGQVEVVRILLEFGADKSNAISAWLAEGAASRIVGRTAFNARSSRSHAVATIHICWNDPQKRAMARVAALALSAGGLAFVVPRSSTSTSSLRGVSVSAPAAEPTSSASWGAAAATATAALGLAAASATSATRRTARKAVGVCLPLTDKFDPLNLASTDEKLERYTQVEIKHGRVAMIAVVGYIMPEIFRFPGCESFQHGLAALESIPLEGWVQLVALVGAHEVLVKPRAGGLGSSDFGLGTELIDGIDEAELERKQTSERNNGRLAMVAIMGLMVQDGMFGEPPLSYMSKYGWWGEPVQWYVQHLNNCQSFSGSFVDNAGVCALPSRGGRTALRATKLSEGPFIETETYPAPKEMEMSAAVPFLRYPQVLKGWVGEEKGFDPLGVTDALPVYWVREAELKHGRVCMLATVGWIATDLGMRFPGDQFQSVQTTLEAHDKMVEAGLMAPFLGAVGTFELYSLWLFFKGWEMEVNRDAGDFFLGKQFLPKEPAKEKDMRLKELENGRLAMFAFSGIVTQAAMTGQAWPFM
ncbi:unnamed protein product [Effrenium voratum]|uniref:Kinesin motor domain-containing protein n=1 Tax=Effrenium voratum TaxID=2562239 RepID=A0AA36MZ23_9DINO|nr:unnamed protein product [Effrenium voratum]